MPLLLASPAWNQWASANTVALTHSYFHSNRVAKSFTGLQNKRLHLVPIHCTVMHKRFALSVMIVNTQALSGVSNEISQFTIESIENCKASFLGDYLDKW